MTNNSRAITPTQIRVLLKLRLVIKNPSFENTLEGSGVSKQPRKGKPSIKMHYLHRTESITFQIWSGLISTNDCLNDGLKAMTVYLYSHDLNLPKHLKDRGFEYAKT